MLQDLIEAVPLGEIVHAKVKNVSQVRDTTYDAWVTPHYLEYIDNYCMCSMIWPTSIYLVLFSCIPFVAFPSAQWQI